MPTLDATKINILQQISVLKGLAYPVNGIIMGGLDWKFTMAAMWLANFVCVGMVRFWAKNNTMTLGKIWWSLAAFMGSQVVTGAVRFQSKTGVWNILKGKEKDKIGNHSTSSRSGR